MGIRRFGRALGRLSVAGLLLYGVTFTAVFAVDQTWPRVVPADVNGATIVCLGAGAGVVSANRATICGEIAAANPESRIVLSGGGQGEVMLRAVEAVGVPESRVLREMVSESTLQNALFSGRMIDRTRPVVVVSDAYHLPRSWASFRLMGYRDVTVASTAAVGCGWRCARREAAAVWFNLARYVVWRCAFWVPDEPRDLLLY